MNIHPIFVHFPVAFFTIYALAEIVRFNFLTRQPFWFYVKAVLVIVGSASSVVTLTTGLMVEKYMVGHPALPYHKFFAFFTAGLFAIIALSYALVWINKEKQIQNNLWQTAVNCARGIVESKLIVILALLGLISVTITGGFGGIMAYGEGADPFFTYFYKLFIK